jgi:hypothetical protein
VRHEIAQRFAEVDQLAQFNAYPGRVDHAYIQTQYLAQSVEGACDQLHRVGAALVVVG